jgi:hypothetical protein
MLGALLSAYAAVGRVTPIQPGKQAIAGLVFLVFALGMLWVRGQKSVYFLILAGAAAQSLSIAVRAVLGPIEAITYGVHLASAIIGFAGVLACGIPWYFVRRSERAK